ncbi:hypothetical protein SPHINGO391_360103 [Sphingomonas aurantiaca]|uniref:Uncharacterized protein n=1 Tax=Sphingomonas aurantiaca TaxID=185949 RepID=A0A5E7YJ21_9SPHN|nr:hypothetical protein SPHINGO391_360103 [Sphingomonas aurantiaca]
MALDPDFRQDDGVGWGWRRGCRSAARPNGYVYLSGVALVLFASTDDRDTRRAPPPPVILTKVRIQDTNRSVRGSGS